MPELKPTEPHPAAADALNYISSIPRKELYLYLESYSTVAIEGNRLGDVCGETIQRLLNADKVSDRYVLGLAWSLRNMREKTE